MSFLLAAHHKGPRLTLEPVAEALDRARFVRPGEDCEALIRKTCPQAVLRGFSKAEDPENPEPLLARAAARAGLPVIGVEDYPGNFAASEARFTTALCVEFPGREALYRRRGLSAERVLATGNPRYALLPRPPAEGARRRLRRALGLAMDRPAVLWAGQPDPAHERGTLAALLPALARLGASAVIRRHPNHPRAPLPAGPGLVVDGSGPDALALAASCDLVATQFSSLAVEAGYLGVPSLFLLLPGLGAAYHRAMTGEEEPPWCAAGLAFKASGKAGLAEALRKALSDQDARRESLLGWRGLARRSAGAAARIAALARALSAAGRV